MIQTHDIPVFRFAPSPNGLLHLGHAYSALLNHDMAAQHGGRLLLRIEDIDTARCNALYEEQMLEDLHWLGIRWQGEPRRQSEHFADYRAALDALQLEGLIYPAFLSRKQRQRLIEERQSDTQPWPRDPDGALLYPDDDRRLLQSERQQRIEAGDDFALRLDMQMAIERLRGKLTWQETGAGPEGQCGIVGADPCAWGDIVLARKDTPTSYHLSVVIDDALQGITHVVRGRDLFYATAVHRLLQELLGLAPPVYHHHQLIVVDDGRKLSKSQGDTSIKALRQAGATPNDIHRMVGLA